MANKASGPRALLANIPTPLNFQLVYTGSIFHLSSWNNQKISLKTGQGNTENVLGNTKNHTRLIQVKEEGWTGFSEKQPCQPEENPVHPDYLLGFTFYLKKNILVIILNFSNVHG